MNRLALPILLLAVTGAASGGDCPLLVEPERITANTRIMVNWKDVLVCDSAPTIEISGSMVTVDFNFQSFCGVVPPGGCGENRALIGNLPAGSYTLIAIGHGRQRSLDFDVLPVSIPSLGAVGRLGAVLLILGLAFVQLTKRSKGRQQAGAAQRRRCAG